MKKSAGYIAKWLLIVNPYFFLIFCCFDVDFLVFNFWSSIVNILGYGLNEYQLLSRMSEFFDGISMLLIVML